MFDALTVLGIETSCDETAAAVVRSSSEGGYEILSNQVLSQIEEHRPYGGVVPEIAARAHVEHLDGLVKAAMIEAGLGFADLSAVAATAGPGLIGGVIVGLMTGKTLALAHERPFVAVNHLEGHALSVLLDGPIAFPFLLLLISGGHCQLLIVREVGRYRRLGSTLDDAVGEAFDKTAKLLELGYPGGPLVEKAALSGDGQRYDFPRPLLGREGCDFSFSGLKTAVRHTYEPLKKAANKEALSTVVPDIAASFQATVADVLWDRSRNAMMLFQQAFSGFEGKPSFVVAGGVAANVCIRDRLTHLCAEAGFEFRAPPLRLCTDNAAMIACAGLERFRRGYTDSYDFAPRARWPLAEMI